MLPGCYQISSITMRIQHGQAAKVMISDGSNKIQLIWWLRYFQLRLIFIITMVNIVTCVGARYAVSSSYGDLITFLVMVSLKITQRFQEFVGTAKFATHYVDQNRSTNLSSTQVLVLLRRVCYALGRLDSFNESNRPRAQQTSQLNKFIKELFIIDMFTFTFTSIRIYQDINVSKCP